MPAFLLIFRDIMPQRAIFFHHFRFSFSASFFTPSSADFRYAILHFHSYDAIISYACCYAFMSRHAAADFR